MIKIKIWFTIISFLILIVFVFLFLGFLLDIKYTVESFHGISTKIIETSYRHVYGLSSIILVQFILIGFLISRLKK